MAYLLRILILLMMLLVMTTFLSAMDWIPLGLGHIKLAIPTLLYCIFAQAFVMFYFIGVSRFVNNVWEILHSKSDLKELFEIPPEDIRPYIKKTKKFMDESNRCKRQTIPWTMLMLILGMMGFLLGGAHDTGLVEKTTHVGPVYGFITVSTIGFFRQWHYLGRVHLLLRKMKALYGLPDNQM